MHWFKNLCTKDPSGKMLPLKQETPNAVKCAAEAYQKSKNSFYSHCQKNNIGKWLSAPTELDLFKS